ncbi:exotoxin beta-grasp domain-containing protein [Staphylococcus agnetis]|uniref:Exotoxin n=1 Tax=Staphylococcus agnetis TaxID=985762 RepID=A0A2T4MCT6_9STAP|nr:exotoxin beta-grasp domain-containing protein [Staphylococcus agnetis]NJI01814.1 exotoxin [Staphylococcus agnetis]PTH26410.1 exotoxin [Staphylococcus agnetis]PTH38012.1 exotoxin [Staphylococcus agnetis]
MKRLIEKLLILIILASFSMLILSYVVNAKEAHSSDELHKKRDLDSLVLSRVKHSYGLVENAIAESKNTNEKFLQNSLVFKKFFQSHSLYNDLLVDFESESTANNLLNKTVDIYGVKYGNRCYGGEIDKTACIYGGVTLRENNIYTEEKNVPINLWIDNKKEKPTFKVTTKKKKVTIQELDAKVRKHLSDKYNIYETDSFGGEIQKGRVIYETSSESIEYDLYKIDGEFADTYLRIYQDNKIVSSDNLHIDIYLYKK